MPLGMNEIELERINTRLKDQYGSTENFPNFRIIWSESQVELQLCRYTENGVALLIPEMREVPKYRQWIQNKYILEGLKIVPNFQQKELSAKLSYEPIWTFEREGEAVLPMWPAVNHLLEVLKSKVEKRPVKYEEGESAEVRKARLEKLHEEMFGNETAVTDALTYKEGIVVPANFTKSGDNNGNRS